MSKWTPTPAPSAPEAVSKPPQAVRSARIVYTEGLTINLGNYESRRVDVSITLECADAPETIEATYEAARTWVQEKLKEARDGG